MFLFVVYLYNEIFFSESHTIRPIFSRATKSQLADISLKQTAARVNTMIKISLYRSFGERV